LCPIGDALVGNASHVVGIEEFDSCERNLRLESGCWSMIRATNHALQPREIRPNTRVRVETKAVTGRSPKPAAGGVAATKGGSQQMNRIPVSSQGITEVGYHEEADSRGTLELKFSNGGVYEFFNVPTKMYDEFMHASSRDDYYRANIGKRFPCTRVG
jgi:KTSC domain